MSSTIFAVCGSSSRDPRAALAVLRELEDRRRDGKPRLAGGHGGEALALADGVGQVLVEPLLHPRLVVEQVHLRRRADHVEVDGPLRLGREVRQPRASRVAAGILAAPSGLVAQQAGQRDGAEARGRLARRTGGGFRAEHEFVQRIHGRVPHLFSTSSRFRIWLATMRQAASSAGAELGVGLSTRRRRSASCAARDARRSRPGSRVPGGVDARRAPWRRTARARSVRVMIVEPRVEIVGARFEHALGEVPRGLDELRVVHRHQRLQRRVGALAPHACSSRGSAR